MEEGVDPKFLETQRRLQEEARERNRSEFGEEGEAARLRLEGFRAGLYVRLVLKKVPVEFVKVRTVRYVITIAVVVIVFFMAQENMNTDPDMMLLLFTERTPYDTIVLLITVE